MKMSDIMDRVLDRIQENDLSTDRAQYSTVQNNLSACVQVIEFILNELYKGEMYKIDTSEFFNLVVIRMNNLEKITYDDSMNYYDTTKKFQELFKESGINVNLVMFVGNMFTNNYNLVIE
jgi:hypothetical protein